MREPHKGLTWLRRFSFRLLLAAWACCLTSQMGPSQPLTIINYAPARLGPPQAIESATPRILEFVTSVPGIPQFLEFEPRKQATPQALEFAPPVADKIVLHPVKFQTPQMLTIGACPVPTTPSFPPLPPEQPAFESPERASVQNPEESHAPVRPAAVCRPAFGTPVVLHETPDAKRGSAKEIPIGSVVITAELEVTVLARLLQQAREREYMLSLGSPDGTPRSWAGAANMIAPNPPPAQPIHREFRGPGFPLYERIVSGLRNWTEPFRLFD